MPNDYFGGDPRAQARAAEHGAILGYFNVVKNAGRNAKGQFTSFQGYQKRVNRELADQLQEIVADNIRSRYKRPGVATGRLVTATEDARNRIADLDGFYVGIEDWMAKSQAKYWRTIEFGSAEVWKRPFVGTKLIGWFGTSIQGFYENAWGTVPMAGPEYSRPGQGSGGKFRPYNRATAQELKKEARSGRGTVRHEIEPMHAYRDAWRQFGGAQRVARETEIILRRLVEE